MGLRGEVFSTKFVANDRTYFFNVKENVRKDAYLNLVESKMNRNADRRYERKSVVIYGESISDFVKTFQRALDFIKDESSDFRKGYSVQFTNDRRTYSFKVAATRRGDSYLTITEKTQKPAFSDFEVNADDDFLVQEITVYTEDIGSFVREFQKTLDFFSNYTKRNQ